MSVYNHRFMIPTPQSTRLLDVLESIRMESEKLSQELFVYKSQRDEYEIKVAQQVKEMTMAQNMLIEIERVQHRVKIQQLYFRYEEEVSRLRQQLEATQPALRTLSTENSQNISLEVVPENHKIERHDWFALFNPSVKQELKPNLVHSFDHNSVVCCVKFSPNGRFLATGCNRVTCVYDVSTGYPICVLKEDSIDQQGDLYIRSICFSPDGRLLATGAEDKKIRIWDVANKRVLASFVGHEQDIYSLDFNRDGSLLASGSGDSTTRIWNISDGTCLHVMTIKDSVQNDSGITSVAFSPDGGLVATGSLDNMVRVWSTHSGRMLEKLEGHTGSVYSVAFMSNEMELASGSLDNTIKMWRLASNVNRPADNPVDPCKMTLDFVLSIACTSDGKWILSGSKDKSVQLWDVKTGQPQFMIQGHKNSVISVAATSDGKPLFASGSGDTQARIWSY